MSHGRFNVNLAYDVYSQQCYDAMWALAYALNDTLTGETRCTYNFICRLDAIG